MFISIFRYDSCYDRLLIGTSVASLNCKEGPIPSTVYFHVNLWKSQSAFVEGIVSVYEGFDGLFRGFLYNDCSKISLYETLY